MYAPLVFLVLGGSIYVAVRIRRARQRRADAAMVVTTWPEIELRQTYGGWDADAYDAGTDHDRSPRDAVRFVAAGVAPRVPGRSR